MKHTPSISRRDALLTVPAAAVAALGAASVARADEAEVTTLTSATAVKFLYIDTKELASGAEQHIVVSLVGFDEVGESATLSLEGSEGAASATCELTKASGASLLFSLTPQEGTYTVASLSFASADGGAYVVDFSDSDASCRSFTVGEVATAATVEDGVATECYVSDDEDGLVAASSVDEALEQAVPESSIALMSADPASSGLIVALDPGHGGSDPGAQGVGGASEDELCWQITSYCREELECYRGVTVVMTKEKGEDVSIQDRVQRAVDQGANAIVSIHLNSTNGGSNGTAHGAEVYAPYDASYNPETHTLGVEMGDEIISELASLGLTNRGVKFRTISDTSYNYDNGDNADYYGIIRYARKAGIPGIIVEHAFIDNKSDYQQYLSNAFKLMCLGVADATGVASAYDLAKAKDHMYRLYNPNTGEHFYTASYYEANSIVKAGWQYENVGWTAPTSSNTPVFRLYNPYVYGGDHHYTTSSVERDSLVAAGWRYERIGWYSDDAQGVPLYRQYNPNAVTGTHNYTTSKQENDSLVAAGWRAEGVAWYGLDPNASDDAVTSSTPIMGETVVTGAQLAAYYNSKVGESTYPSSVYTDCGAVTVEEFGTILVEEAKAEGVRAEAVFVQEMKETGWLRFGGKVKVEQCNFAGLGATNEEGVVPATFPDVRTGIRAHVQHLKAYATTDALVNECVDPRFDIVTRGIAPTLEELNGRWAVPGDGYGEALSGMIDDLMSFIAS